LAAQTLNQTSNALLRHPPQITAQEPTATLEDRRPSPTTSGDSGDCMGSKVVEIAFGVFFCSLSAMIFFCSDSGLAYLAAFLLGGLGAEVLYSAIRGRRSLLSRLGPLP
jgi:hypothetical protein